MAPPAVLDLPIAPQDDCDACEGRLREGLSEHRGVVRVEDASGRRSMRVSYDPDLCSADCLEGALHDLRRDLETSYQHGVSRLEGMDCADCALKIERAVGRLTGVTDVAVNFPAATLRVEYRPEIVGFERIAGRVARLGYRIAGAQAPASRLGLTRLMTRRKTTVLASLLLILGLALDAVTGTAATLAYAAAAVTGGIPLARSGIAALLATRRPDITLLMTIAVVGAAAIGAWFEAAAVVVLFAIGALLEERAVDRARRELAGLVALTPPTARVRRSRGAGPLAVFEEVEIDVADVCVGDVVVIRPGERVPVDGTVRDGSSSVDQAPITGESTPVDKAVGDAVFAGTLNVQGLLVVRADSAPGDTTLDRIGALVAEAQARKSPSERWVDGFARVYTPAVVGLALLVAVVPPLAGVAFSSSFYAALSLLILACPCALVISTPVAIVSALGRASAAGVLVKGGVHLEQAATVRSVAFDKTGTLTQGRPQVVAVEALDGDDAGLLSLAAALEAGSEHPLARAIVGEARARSLELAEVRDFEAHTGLGATGMIGARAVTVGDLRLVPDPPAVLQNMVARQRAAGRTAVLVVADDEPLGLIGLADAVRPEAAEAVADLRRLGIERLVLLTGDNAVTAAATASAVDIDDVRAGLLPQHKAEVIATLGDGVAMLGDGVNDAPALATSGLGVAMGSAGSDTAIEVADVAIMGDDPRKLAGLIGLARWTRSVVRQNIVFSLATKLIAVLILLAGALPLWGAVVADVGASLIVVSNGLRLVKGRPWGSLRHLPLLSRTSASRTTDANTESAGGTQSIDACCSRDS